MGGSAAFRDDGGHSAEKWLHNFGQRGKWNFCLATGTLVLANQEQR
jgi:hypothetical protein